MPIEVDNENTFALNGLAYQQFNKGEVKNALKLIERSLNIHAYQPDMFKKAADHLIYYKKFSQAEQLLNHAVAVSKNPGEYYKRLGFIKLLSNEITEAQYYFRQALVTIPDDNELLRIINKLENMKSNDE